MSSTPSVPTPTNSAPAPETVTSPAPSTPAETPAAPAQAAEPNKPEVADNPAKTARAISAAIAEKRQRLAAEARVKTLEVERDGAKKQAEEVAAKLDRFKSDPLAALDAVGLTYEQITQAAISKHGKNTPAARLEAIEAKLKADEAAKAKAEEDGKRQKGQQEVQARITSYVESVHSHSLSDKTAYELLSAENPDYAKGLIFDVADEIARRTGKVPDAKSVCDMIEEYLVGEGVRYANSAKVKGKLSPPPAASQAASTVSNPAVEAAITEAKRRASPRTLTNKLSAAPVSKPPETNGKLSPQEAMKVAMAAFRESQAKNNP
jgi:hypothetical protein